MSKKIKQIITLILILTSIIYTSYQNFFESKKTFTGELQSHFINVGQGDSTLIIMPNGKTVLIDAGEERYAQKVINYIKDRGISKLDLVIATHPDADHIGGMDKIIKNFDIGVFSMPNVKSDTRQYREILVELRNKNIKNKALYTYDEIYLDDSVEYEIVSPIKDKKYSDTNEYSIVSKIKYGNTSFLMMGDATIENEAEIINNIPNIDIDVLKLGHHGSSTSTSEYFLKKTTPNLAIISCGKNNRYNHPHKEVINLLKKHNIKSYRTDISGDIVIKSDGNKITSNV